VAIHRRKSPLSEHCVLVRGEPNEDARAGAPTVVSPALRIRQIKLVGIQVRFAIRTLPRLSVRVNRVVRTRNGSASRSRGCHPLGAGRAERQATAGRR